MQILDSNKDGVVSKTELKNAIKEVMQEAQAEGTNQNRGKKIAKAISNLVFMRTKIPEHLKIIYTGKGSAAERLHTGNSGCNINNCHTHGLSNLRKTINVKAQPNTLGNLKKGLILEQDLHIKGLEKLRRLR